jgi:CsoR family transcriptional regulator, copper-sensing transcriptional repressor
MEDRKRIQVHGTKEGIEVVHNQTQLHSKAQLNRPLKGHIKRMDSLPEHNHNHNHSHGAEHSHTHKNTKMVLDRLSRASGHLDSVKRMVLEGKDCSEVLIQLSAVIAALNNTGKVILKDHIENCIVEAVESGDKDALDQLNSAIDRFIK